MGSVPQGILSNRVEMGVHRKKSLAARPSSEIESWIRRINERWLVRSDLQDHAEAYLDHLAEADPERLQRTCQLVLRMMETAPPDEDPKPRFYGALFCLATAAEKETFLTGHRFTQLALPDSRSCEADLDLSAPSLEKLAVVRQAIRDCLLKD